jgi:hypothetical protein
VPSAADSVYLRTVSTLLVRARLTAPYRAILRSTRAVLWRHPTISHIQATASRLHGCNNRAKYVSQRVPILFSGEFRKLNNEKLANLGGDCWWATMTVALSYLFRLHTRDRAVRSAEMALFASIYLLQRCLQNRHGENKEYHPNFYFPLLRSAECGWNNVGKLEIVFRRVWLIVVVLPNWIGSCGLFSEILYWLDSISLPWYTLFRYLYWCLKMYAKLYLRLSLSALRKYP